MPTEGPVNAPAGPRTVLAACAAMGTRFELVLLGPDEGHLRAAAEAAIDEILYWHRCLNWFDPGSFLSHLNATAAARPVRCDGEFFDLLLVCRAVWQASGGAFDPSVAALLRASGLRDLPRDSAAIALARQAVGYDKIELDPARRSARFTRPGVGLDFGAVGKGWALDRARTLLAQAGVTCALLHGGTSSVLAIGSPPGQSGWVVTVGRRPDAPSVTMCDGALGVSAPHGRLVSEGGQQHGHVLDPRDGRSARAAGLAAVLADSAALADAWSTAALVVGDRPGGMPAEFTCLTAPADGQPGAWRISGPGASTLCARTVPAHQREEAP